MNLYYEAPICNVAQCLYKDMVFCTSELHNITPNDCNCRKAEYPTLEN